tara:strand:+ start:128 stop:382 length:255 start_codon:yes stop_codon:yes gene_type:complete
MKTYSIIRFYREGETENKTIKTGLTLEEAQEHCQDPDTECAEYFDGYEGEESEVRTDEEQAIYEHCDKPMNDYFEAKEKEEAGE